MNIVCDCVGLSAEAGWHAGADVEFYHAAACRGDVWVVIRGPRKIPGPGQVQT